MAVKSCYLETSMNAQSVWKFVQNPLPVSVGIISAMLARRKYLRLLNTTVPSAERRLIRISYLRLTETYNWKSNLFLPMSLTNAKKISNGVVNGREVNQN